MSKHLALRVQAHWRQPSLVWSCLLWPLSLLFAGVSALRRLMYRLGWKKSQQLPIPVVVVGNIHVGGVGKTPVVMALARSFQVMGFKVGVISRGYGRHNSDTLCVAVNGSAADYGDEPLLIAQATGVPVAVGRSRYEAGLCLLAAHPDLDLILTDDGLQHYALHRDFEIVVLSAAQGWTNTGLLPHGPLREPVGRIKHADAVVVTQAERLLQVPAALPKGVPQFLSRLHADAFYRLQDPQQKASAADFKGKQVTAVAGIGQPEKFYQTLQDLGLTLSEKKAFPDHHVYQADDLPSEAEVIVVTEKDAVKLKNIPLMQVWVLPVSATIEPNLAAFVCTKLGLSAPVPSASNPLA